MQLTKDQAAAIFKYSAVFSLLRHDSDSIARGFQYVAIKTGIPCDLLIRILKMYDGELLALRYNN